METETIGSKDGAGASDNDEPYKFGVYTRYATIRTRFSERQTARLMVLRSKVRAGLPVNLACAHNQVQLDADGLGFECLGCGTAVSD